jgi:hypothetical protein
VESFESDHSAGGILPQKKSLLHPMRSTALLLISLRLLYEYALSLRVSFDHNRRLLIDNCHGANSVRHGESVQWRTEHDAVATFPDHERS